MKSILILAIALTSSISFAGSLSKNDYRKIKAAITKYSTNAMLKENYIYRGLTKGDFDTMKVTIDILSDKNVVNTKSVVLPDEDNCSCQDVFDVYMKIEKRRNFWFVQKNSVKVIHHPTDQ